MVGVQEGSFAIPGTYQLPPQFADRIPAFFMTIPFLSAHVALQLHNQEGKEVACIKRTVRNGNKKKPEAKSAVPKHIAIATPLISLILVRGTVAMVSRVSFANCA
jgi:hypothetical protein